MGETVRSVQVRIEGRVQGVGYRVWTQRTALGLDLEGWVRNRRDGSVEAVFQGVPERVAAMLTACEGGPRGARVTRVAVLAEGVDAVTGFEVRETA